MRDIPIWIKIGDVFINQDNIRGIARIGNGTRITRIIGDDIEVEVDYDKVRAMLPDDDSAEPEDDHL